MIHISREHSEIGGPVNITSRHATSNRGATTNHRATVNHRATISHRATTSCLAAAAVCAALLAAACSGPGSGAGPSLPPQAGGPVPQAQPTQASSHRPPAVPAANSSKHAGSSSAQPTAAPTPTASGPPPLASCTTASLHASLGTSSGDAGTFIYPILLTNTSGSACTLFGYPGVSVVTSPGGSQVGGAAARIGTFAAGLVTIQPGGTVHASMQTPNAGLFSASACKPVTVLWLRVYPPNQFTALYISVPTTPNPVQLCTGNQLGGAVPLGIFVVMAGSTG
jgi:hypothetical protein